MRCKHYFQYSQGSYRCSKCGKRSQEKRYKKTYTKNHNKAYASVAVILGIVILLFFVNENYDITIDNQKTDEIIHINEITRTLNDVSNMVTTTVSDSIPIKIEPKPETLEDKLLDCSVYKKGYVESYQDSKSTPDNVSAMMGDALTGIKNTRACEAYNDKVYQEFGVLGHCSLPPLTGFDIGNTKGDFGLSYKQLFIKYCGQAEYEYVHER